MPPREGGELGVKKETGGESLERGFHVQKLKNLEKIITIDDISKRVDAFKGGLEKTPELLNQEEVKELSEKVFEGVEELTKNPEKLGEKLKLMEESKNKADQVIIQAISQDPKKLALLEQEQVNPSLQQKNTTKPVINVQNLYGMRNDRKREKILQQYDTGGNAKYKEQRTKMRNAFWNNKRFQNLTGKKKEIAVNKAVDEVFNSTIDYKITATNIVKYEVDRTHPDIQTFINDYQKIFGKSFDEDMKPFVTLYKEYNLIDKKDNNFDRVAMRKESGIHNFVYENSAGLDLEAIPGGEDFWETDALKKLNYIEHQYPTCYLEAKMSKKTLATLQQHITEKSVSEKDKEELKKLQEIFEKEITSATAIRLRKNLAEKYCNYMQQLTQENSTMHIQIPLDSNELSKEGSRGDCVFSMDKTNTALTLPWNIDQGQLVMHNFFANGAQGGSQAIHDDLSHFPSLGSLFQNIKNKNPQLLLQQAVSKDYSMEDIWEQEANKDLKSLEKAKVNEKNIFQNYLAQQQLSHQLMQRHAGTFPGNSFLVDNKSKEANKIRNLDTAHHSSNKLVQRLQSTDIYLNDSKEGPALQRFVMKLIQDPLNTIIKRSIQEQSITSIVDIIALLDDGNKEDGNMMSKPSFLEAKLDALIASCKEQDVYGMNAHLQEHQKNPAYTEFYDTWSFEQSKFHINDTAVVLRKKDHMV